jgi:hypothetical protein
MVTRINEACSDKRRTRIILPASTEFAVSNQRATKTADVLPYQASKMIGTGTMLTRTDSGLRRVLGAFGTIPSQETWLKSGIVERQTVSTDMRWLPRLMILTSDAIMFVKEGSDVILDHFPLKNIMFLGKASRTFYVSIPFLNFTSETS